MILLPCSLHPLATAHLVTRSARKIAIPSYPAGFQVSHTIAAAECQVEDNSAASHAKVFFFHRLEVYFLNFIHTLG
jgi:hypothetical protein